LTAVGSGSDDELLPLGKVRPLLERSTAFSAQRQFAERIARAAHAAHLRTYADRGRASRPNATAPAASGSEQLLRSGSSSSGLIDALLDLSRGHAASRRASDRSAELVGRVMTYHAKGLRSKPHCSGRQQATPVVEPLVATHRERRRPQRERRLDRGLHRDREGRATLSVKNSGPSSTCGRRPPLRALRAHRGRPYTAAKCRLGLSIVKAIAEAHDATITAHPIPKAASQSRHWRHSRTTAKLTRAGTGGRRPHPGQTERTRSRRGAHPNGHPHHRAQGWARRRQSSQ